MSHFFKPWSSWFFDAKEIILLGQGSEESMDFSPPVPQPSTSSFSLFSATPLSLQPFFWYIPLMKLKGESPDTAVTELVFLMCLSPRTYSPRGGFSSSHVFVLLFLFFLVFSTLFSHLLRLQNPALVTHALRHSVVITVFNKTMQLHRFLI